ncbi:xyloglucan O-acetyltransferase 3-like [Silene latifolia]|uniref:xyloglucan O-acetyltransferase 3-like n=1 Tax=Silene latifolia TaxID=37657 RepID=UPI003D77F964
MREFIENTKTNGLASLIVYLIVFTTILSILALYSPFSFLIPGKRLPINLTDHDISRCDLFDGQWVQDPKGPLYKNTSCSTIPSSKNCFLHGRNDTEFLYWRWKPYGCELTRFEPTTFLDIVRDKRLAFIGDSVARNQMESLLCLLSQEETPIDVFKDAKDRSRTWFFPRSNFTLMVLWTRFLIKGVEREGGVFDLHLDQVDENWAQNVSHGVVDFAIVSDSQWFFKKNYLYENGKLIGSLDCNETDVNEFDVGFTIGKAFQTTLRYINDCENCKDMVTIVRTISPSHFENGTWKTGGNCERTKLYNTKDVGDLLTEGKNKVEWEVRNVQLEEVERVRKDAATSRDNFRVMDITKVMVTRPDGHPGSHWRDKKKKGFNDCVHWCMPGPIDVWNDLMLALLSRITL